MSACPASAARCAGVFCPTASCAPASAPPFTSSTATASAPPNAAKCSGVFPCASRASTSASCLQGQSR